MFRSYRATNCVMAGHSESETHVSALMFRPTTCSFEGIKTRMPATSTGMTAHRVIRSDRNALY
jgi:hypothetical protein